MKRASLFRNSSRALFAPILLAATALILLNGGLIYSEDSGVRLLESKGPYRFAVYSETPKEDFWITRIIALNEYQQVCYVCNYESDQTLRYIKIGEKNVGNIIAQITSENEATKFSLFRPTSGACLIIKGFIKGRNEADQFDEIPWEMTVEKTDASKGYTFFGITNDFTIFPRTWIDAESWMHSPFLSRKVVTGEVSTRKP